MGSSNNETTTKFKVDISELKKAMQEAKRQISLANSEFKAVSSSMDNWAKSTTGLQAKLKQLDSNLNSQKTILKNLEAQYDAVVREQGEGSAAADKLKVAINNQKATINNTEKEIKSYGDALKTAEKAEEIAAKTGRDAAEVFDDLADNVDNAGKKAEQSSGGFTVMKGALANLVADGIRLAVDALKDFSASMIDAAATVKAENSKFSQTFGDLESEASEAIKGIAQSTGILDTRLRDTGANIYAFARSSGASTEEAMELMKTSLMATADSAAYYDKSLEDSAETLQSFLKGNYANDAALGVSATEFTRNAKATELFGKKYNDLTEIQKQQTLLKMVTDAQEVSGAMGQASREADGWENVQGNLNEAWRQFQANVGAPFLEALIPIIQDVTAAFKEWSDSVDWDDFNEKVKTVAGDIKTGFQWILDNKDAIIAGLAGIAAGFLAFKVVSLIQGVQKAMEGMTLAQYALNLAMSLNPIGLIVAAIAALVAAFVVLWNKSEAFREFWINLWENIKNGVSSAWEWIKSIFVNAFTWYKSTIIDPILNLFSNVWNSLKNGAAKAWAGIKSIFSNLASFFGNIFSSAWQKVKDIFSTGGKIFDGIKEGIASTFKNIVNKIIAGINKVVSLPFTAINTALGKIKNISILGKKPFSFIPTISVPQIPQLAKGGILKKGQTGFLEGDGAEAVVPLEKNTQWIRNVAKDLADNLKGDSILGVNGSATGGVVNNFYQTNNSPKALSRLEIYRQSKNLLGYAGGV